MNDPYSFEIEVLTNYIDHQSDPGSERFVFAYTITIHNRGAATAQLLTRHWVITDANGQVQEVRGDGVVGEQPLIAPGESFRYTSGAILDTPVGSMHGSYGMVGDDGNAFDAMIAPFTLAAPGTLN